MYFATPLLLVYFLIYLTNAATIVDSDSLSSESNESTSSEYVDPDDMFEERWIVQPVDHFNLFDNRTWKMRYFVSYEFFKPGGPIFIEIGGEAIESGYIFDGPFKDLVKTHNGCLIITEHRYYGKSLPFGTHSFKKNLKYLKVEQALEDLARLIEEFKEINPVVKNSAVVVHGCSYPGMLATWIRLKFPHLVDMAYASSAPLGVGLDYPEYYETVNDVYANVSSECIDTIKEGFKEAHELSKTPEGLKTLKESLKDWDCTDINEMDAPDIMATMVDIINVQNDALDYEKLSCTVLKYNPNNSVSAFQRLALLTVAKSEDSEDCKEKSIQNQRDEIAWFYQVCTEFGTFQTLSTNNSRHPFGEDWPMADTLDVCRMDFGEEVNEELLRKGVAQITRRYGGLNPAVTKVVTIQGTHDPWKHLAKWTDYNEQAPVILVTGSHCIDVYEFRDNSTELQNARQRVKDYISKWLQEV